MLLRYLLLFALAILLSMPAAASGKDQKTFSGEIALGQEYDSNIDRVRSDEESEWKSRISPDFIFTRLTNTSRFLINYSPSIVHTYRTDDERIDHFASASYDLQMTRKLSVDFRNTFIRTEDPYEDRDVEVDGIRIADRRGKNRYWTNDFNTRMSYQYAKDSFVDLGYQYRVLENSEGGFSDYVKHSPDISVLYRINHQWDVSYDYGMTFGEFDSSDDLVSADANFYIYYNHSPFTTLFGHYGYSQTDYDGPSSDYDYNTLSTGVERQFSPTLDCSFEVGVSLLQRESDSDTNAFYLRSALDKQWQYTTWTLSGESGLDEQQFSGADDLGLSRYWAIKTGFIRTLAKNWTGHLNFSYREDTYLDRRPEEKENRFRSDVRLAYSFARWYRISIGYTYVNLDAEFDTDSYEDHRASLQLSAARDLFKW